MDQIFLSKENLRKNTNESVETEFTLVKDSQARPGKVFAKPKQRALDVQESSDDPTLGDVINFHRQAELAKQARQREEEQQKLKAEIWNYLGANSAENSEAVAEPKLSFDEIMK